MEQPAHPLHVDQSAASSSPAEELSHGQNVADPEKERLRERAALTSASSSCRSFAFRMRVRDVSDHQAFASLYPGKQVRHMHFRFGDFKGSRHRCRLLSSARGSRIRASPRLSASGRLVPSALRQQETLHNNLPGLTGMKGRRTWLGQTLYAIQICRSRRAYGP